MVGPDLGVVYLDWGGEKLALRFPLGAVRALSAALGASVEIDELSKIPAKLNGDTLAIWFWAAMIHGRRDDPTWTHEAARELIEWGSVGARPLIQAITTAWTAGMFGTLPNPVVEKPDAEDEEDERPKVRSGGPGRWRVASLFSSAAWRRRRSGGAGTSPRSSSTPTPLGVER